MSSELTTSYLGMELASPVIVGSCPLTVQPEHARQFFEAGAGAIVFPSMLQEQVVHATIKRTDPDRAISQSGYQPQHDKYNGGPEKYLEAIRRQKANSPLPVIASVNGYTAEPWLEYLREIKASGADAIELNWQRGVFDPSETAEQLEDRLCGFVSDICAAVAIPVAVKINQRYTNIASVAHKVQDAGADGLVLFSHRPQWDVDVNRMHWTIRWELSPLDSLGAILEGIVHARSGGLDMSIAASGGVRTSEDAIKTMIAGADVVMVTSEIYRSGPDAVRDMVKGISRFLDRSPFDSLSAFQHARPEVKLGPERLMRLEYVDPLTRSDHYYDPNPVASTHSGDAFGHKAT